MTDLAEILKSATPLQIQKAKTCKTADELLDFAKSEKLGISPEQAEKAFEMISTSTGELTDEEMDHVAGGCEKLVEAYCPYCVQVYEFSPSALIAPLTVECYNCHNAIKINL